MTAEEDNTRELLRRAMGVMFQGWMIQLQTETECIGMNTPGKPCDPVEQCRCKNQITEYIEIAKGRERRARPK